MPSMPVVMSRINIRDIIDIDSKWALDENYEVVKMNQPEVKSYFETGLKNYKIDWI
jgi:hypothetical protein